MTEPELVDVDGQNDSSDNLANRVKRQYQMVDDSMMQQYSSVENGEVRDEDEQEGSIQQKVERGRLSVVSESEVRDDEEEYSYTNPEVYSKAASGDNLRLREHFGQLNAYSSLQQIPQSRPFQKYLIPPST